jgi:hypothetical protein
VRRLLKRSDNRQKCTFAILAQSIVVGQISKNARNCGSEIRPK